MPTGEQLGLLLLVAIALIGLAVWIPVRRRRNPVERERRRRSQVNQVGRLGDAMVTEVQDNTLYYSYSIRGVAYSAAQDIVQLRGLLPDNPECLVGPVTIKYLSSNPANSILICEEWSGFHQPFKPHGPDPDTVTSTGELSGAS